MKLQAFKAELQKFTSRAESEQLEGTRAEQVCLAAAEHVELGKVPSSIGKALRREQSEAWSSTLRDEMQKLATASTTMLEKDIPAGNKAVPSRVVLAEKRDKDGKLIKLKVRITARGDKIDYDGVVFAPGYNKDALRVVIATATKLELQLVQADVTGAYLSAPSEHITYVRLPPNLEEFGVEPGTVLRLHNAIYGTPMAGRSWSQYNTDILVNHFGCEQLETEPSIYTKRVGGSYMMIHVATDDFLIAHNDSDMISSFIEDYQQFAPIRFEGLAKK